MKKDDNTYDRFIRSALAAGFTDDQVNWLESWLYDELPAAAQETK